MQPDSRTTPQRPAADAVPSLAQCAGAVCMIEPAAFGFNAETAATNRLQHAPDSSPASAAAMAATAAVEAAALALQLARAGVRVCTVADSPLPPKPDAVFPNNWISFHADGAVVLYPMLNLNRRIERREDLVHAVTQRLGFLERRRIDLTHHENAGRYLEGTGSLVADHRERVVYACRSPRTDESLVLEWARLMDYEPVIFDARTPDGAAVYHTNVLLWIGERAAGVGSAWIDAADRARVSQRLRASGREVLEFDERALRGFAGNMLELRAGSRRVLVMSATVERALDAAQLARLEAVTDELLIAPVPVIERLGGGSVRCMLAEVPLP